MASSSGLPILTAGAFYGAACHAVSTASFQFSELQATVPDREVPRHTHESAHFILITGGVYRTEARNQTGDCFPGTLIFNPAGTTHRDCFRSDRGRFLSISPRKDALRLLDEASPVPLMVERTGFPWRDESAIGDRILRETRLGVDVSIETLEGFGFELIGRLAGIHAVDRSQHVPGWLVRVREMIDDGGGAELTIAELAASEQVHPVYLARAYRRHFGCSPGEHLRGIRLLRAQGLLSGTDLPVVDIALQCGFSDQSQLTRSFSSRFGVPPARYRWLHKR